MNDTLKVAGRIGAELGAAKAENERLRGLLTTLRVSLNLDDTEYGLSQQEKRKMAADIDAELSRQPEPMCETMQRPKAECGCPDCGSSLIDWPTAEPTDAFTAVDMATAAAQGFMDGQAAVEQAAAQDERDPIEKAAFDARLRRDFEARWPVPKGVTWGAGVGDYYVSEFASGIALSYPDMWMAYKAGAARGKA